MSSFIEGDFVDRRFVWGWRNGCGAAKSSAAAAVEDRLWSFNALSQSIKYLAYICELHQRFFLVSILVTPLVVRPESLHVFSCGTLLSTSINNTP